MVNKSSYVIAFFAMIFLAVSLASAIQFQSNDISMNVSQGDSIYPSLVIYNENLTNYSNALFELSGNLSGLSVSISNVSSITNNTNSTSAITIRADSNAAIGVREFTLTVKGDNSTTDNLHFSINVTRSDENKILYEICKDSWDDKNISGIDKFDSDDLEDWRAFDKISLTLENIQNDGEDRDSFDISLLFYKGTEDKTSKVVTDKDDLKVRNIRIDDDDDADVDFDFTIDGDADDGNYAIYAKVVGDEAGCYAKYVGTANIEKEDGDYSIVSNVNGPSSSSCGENVDLTVTVSNIGEDDADRVKVILYNRDLGINMYREIDNLDNGDEAMAYFSFVAPQNAVEKSYKFLLYTEFDYDDDDEEYGETSDDEYDYSYTLSLSGNCVDPTKPTLSAKLNSSAVVGEDLVVAVTFKNNGNVSTSAIIAPEDFESWAELLSEPETITVGRSESKTVYITFKPIKAGQQTFNINAIYNGKSVDQPVTVSIEANPSVISSLKEKFGVTGAYLVLGIAILVFLIILVLIVKFIFWLFRKH